MNLKISTAIVLLGMLMACKNTPQNTPKTEEEAHEHHEEGVVVLTEQQRKVLNLKLGTFQMRNLTTVVKINGQLEVPPSARAQITAAIGGNVKEIKVFHGDRVKRGQALAVLEHPGYIELQENFAEIANQLEYLELEYERQKELFENNVGAGRDFQQAKSEYNIAKAKYEGLKSRLQLLNLSPEDVKNGKISNSITLTAPIKGYVDVINIQVGTYVDAKDNLFEIIDNSEIHADFMVYEKDVHLLELGQRIDFTVSNLPGRELRATIFAIGRSFDQSKRAVHIHARLTDNPGNLIPGMYVSGHIHTDQHFTKALPNGAIVSEGTKWYIFVADEIPHIAEHEGEHHEMAFRMVEIVPGKQDEGFTEVNLVDSMPENAKIVMNEAYYLLADLKKGEAEHHH